MRARHEAPQPSRSESKTRNFQMNKSLPSLAGFCLVVSGCASFWDALAYKPPETAPKATLTLANLHVKHNVSITVFGNPDCTRSALPLSAPLPARQAITKPIEAERPFTFRVSAGVGTTRHDAGTGAVTVSGEGCSFIASYLPRSGAKYELDYDATAERCFVQLSESTSDGARRPLKLEEKIFKMGLTKGSCE